MMEIINDDKWWIVYLLKLIILKHPKNNAIYLNSKIKFKFKI